MRLRRGLGYPTQITVPYVFTVCNPTLQKKFCTVCSLFLRRKTMTFFRNCWWAHLDKDTVLRCNFNFTIYRRWTKWKWNEIFAKPSFEATSKLQSKAWSKFKCEAVIWNSIEASICVENSKKSRHLSLVSVIKKEVSWNFEFTFKHKEFKNKLEQCPDLVTTF